MESDYFADGLSVFVLVEWIRDGFGGCSRGDCGWMVAWLGIVFGTRQFRKYWPDGKHIISGSGDKILRVWDIESGQILASFSGDAPLRACAISPDGRTIVAGDASGMVHFLRLMGA